MKDEYIHFFVKRPVRRSPIINRGYFARHTAFRKHLHQFLNCKGNTDEQGNTKKQILSLGAGFDTTYFQLQVANKKATLIGICSQLRDKVGESSSISQGNNYVTFTETLTCTGVPLPPFSLIFTND